MGRKGLDQDIQAMYRMDLEMLSEILHKNTIGLQEKVLLKQQFKEEKWVVLLIDMKYDPLI